jgi:hypothetical protein
MGDTLRTRPHRVGDAWTTKIYLSMLGAPGATLRCRNALGSGPLPHVARG